ncbi:hypothetical protein BH18ACT2_BH18ACT2_05820 [soil metagenome]
MLGDDELADPAGQFDPGLILATLERQCVDYLLVGGVAARAHGATRRTADLDWVPTRLPRTTNGSRARVAS